MSLGELVCARRRGVAARSVAAGLEAADLSLYAAAARRTLGKIVGGDEGMALVAEAEAGMLSETLKNPARMSAMLVPGFAKLD